MALYFCSVTFAIAACIAVLAPSVIMAVEFGKDFLMGKTNPEVMGISIADYTRYLKSAAIVGGVWTVYAVIFAILYLVV